MSFFILLPVSLVSDLRCELSTAKTSLDTLLMLKATLGIRTSYA
jgi:hypothetical protein